MKPYVDYTLLKSDATDADFLRFCREAKEYPKIVRSVSVFSDPAVIELCAKELAGTKIYVGAVNDFPFGRGGAKTKHQQALIAKKSGAKEVDTVINTGALWEGKYNVVLEELKAVTGIFPGRTKVILETGHNWYTEYLIKKATELSAKAGAFCVKTSTGFVANITVEEKTWHVKWMHEADPELVIKIAGGVKTQKQVQWFFDNLWLPKDKLIFGASSKFWLEK